MVCMSVVSLQIVSDDLIRLGDKRHVMTYVIGAGKTFNMVLSHPDDGSGWDTTEEETIANMRKEFEGWDPV
jgi:salicylate hydroxylase